jgi:hypothetical protein
MGLIRKVPADPADKRFDAVEPMLIDGERLEFDDDLPVRYSALVWTETDPKHRFNCWNYVTNFRIISLRVHGGDVFSDLPLLSVLELGHLDTNTIRVQVHQTHGVVDFLNYRIRPATAALKFLAKVQRHKDERAWERPDPPAVEVPAPDLSRPARPTPKRR